MEVELYLIAGKHLQMVKPGKKLELMYLMKLQQVKKENLLKLLSPIKMDKDLMRYLLHYLRVFH